MSHADHGRLLAGLLRSLDTVVLVRRQSGGFDRIGAEPVFWSEFGEVGTQPCDRFPFLEPFVEEAESIWTGDRVGVARSGIWVERTPRGQEVPLEAVALVVEDVAMLLIERVGTYEELKELLQTVRERSLRHGEELAARDAQRSQLRGLLNAAERSRDDLRAILARLRIGTLLTELDQSLAYLNPTAERLLGVAAEAALGSRWLDLLSLRPDDAAQVADMAARPPADRSKVPVRLEETGHWIDLEIQDEPRDPRRKLVLLYDRTEVQDLRHLLERQSEFQDMIGKSRVMETVFGQIRDLAGIDTTLLIEGETGTGKELVARAVHDLGPRSARPFIAINCAGLTDSILASQLFGHKRGAFTGAVEDHRGFFEAAAGGTIFLDEIGDVPTTVQTSLLRVLQEREIVRLGESKPRRIDVRVVTATHHDLAADVEAGNFRQDLLYRIRVARIVVPPLRDRLEDLPLLSVAFLRRARASVGKPVERISDEAMRVLAGYPWPGNVRELQAAIEHAVIRCRGSVIELEDLPPELFVMHPPSRPLAGARSIGEAEIREALRKTGGSRVEAARELGISRATFYRRLRDLGL